MIEVRPVTLEGRRVRLVPLSLDHEDDLIRAAADEEISAYMPAPLARRENMRRWVRVSSTQAHDRSGRTKTGHRLLQHPGRRVARCEGTTGTVSNLLNGDIGRSKGGLSGCPVHLVHTFVRRYTSSIESGLRLN